MGYCAPFSFKYATRCFCPVFIPDSLSNSSLPLAVNRLTSRKGFSPRLKLSMPLHRSSSRMAGPTLRVFAFGYILDHQDEMLGLSLSVAITDVLTLAHRVLPSRRRYRFS